jgi:xanthine/CO dehydrogenase XdhC/CoxF family maturation factor
MLANSASLQDFFAIYCNRSEPLVLATIIETIGSTYRKAGAQMLIAQDGQAAGLLSGGCAESDLIERAQRVFKTGLAEIATFDTRGSDDVIWGIGLGCEGAMRILLTRLDSTNGYQPFRYILKCKEEDRRGAFALTIETNSSSNSDSLGLSWILEDIDIPTHARATLEQTAQSGMTQTLEANSTKIFFAPVDIPPRLLVLGAGADALPVVELAALLGWQVTIADHRPAYAVAERFPRAKQVLLAPAAELPTRISIDDFDAAVVMSHHLPTDQNYLAILADSNLRYVGLLGPANRRKRLLAEIGERSLRLKNRLAGPVGLDIGAQTPEAIALAIIAEIHAHLHGRSGSSFSGLLQSTPHPAD